MQVKCKKCKQDLTSQAIELLEDKITKVVCPCKEDLTNQAIKLLEGKIKEIKCNNCNHSIYKK